MMHRRAFTLIELMLSATILASVAALTAVLWAQASGWTSDAMSEHRGVRLARVIELMRSQWADRRTGVALDGKGATVRVERDGVEFITATAVLERGWPLVRASYLIEPDLDTGIGRPSAWKLVYEESPIIEFDGPQGAARQGDREGSKPRRPPAAPPVRKTALLRGCDRLALERFGRELRVEARQGQTESEPGAAAVPRREDHALPGWREVEREFAGVPPAIRLVGRMEGREFACVFVIEDSR